MKHFNPTLFPATLMAISFAHANDRLSTFTSDDAGFDKATNFVCADLGAGRPVVIDFTS